MPYERMIANVPLSSQMWYKIYAFFSANLDIAGEVDKLHELIECALARGLGVSASGGNCINVPRFWEVFGGE